MKQWIMPKGLTPEEAKIEAMRCLSCKNPRCEIGCPTQMRICDFIKEIKKDHLEKAYDIINECSSLPNICSIVCPHEKQCVGNCILNHKGKPIECGKLERYVVENVKKKCDIKKKINKNIAIIGAGPAGLSCAKELLINGYSVDIFEQKNYLGGIMTYGIPEYRLEISLIKKLEEELKTLGAKFYYSTKIKESDILKLKEKYDEVFISIGLQSSKKLGILNENIPGVYDAIKYLENLNLDLKFHQGKRPIFQGTVIVIGAGNVAMDAARCAVRDGAKVLIVYRRSRLEVPATNHEITMAESEGVLFQFLNAPIEVIGKDKVEGLKVEEMELGEPDASGRRKPIGTNRFSILPCTTIISAIGQDPEDIYDVNVLKTNHNYLECDSFRTNIEGIYAGGDIVLGAKTVVEAMVCGRKVANDILKNKR